MACKCRVKPTKGVIDGIVYCPIHAAAPRMWEALRQISEGKGAFDRDPLKHAANVIEEHKSIARALLRELKGEEGGPC